MAEGMIGLKAGTGGGDIESLGLSVDNGGYVCQTIDEDDDDNG